MGGAIANPEKGPGDGAFFRCACGHAVAARLFPPRLRGGWRAKRDGWGGKPRHHDYKNPTRNAAHCGLPASGEVVAYAFASAAADVST